MKKSNGIMMFIFPLIMILCIILFFVFNCNYQRNILGLSMSFTGSFLLFIILLLKYRGLEFNLYAKTKEYTDQFIRKKKKNIVLQTKGGSFSFSGHKAHLTIANTNTIEGLKDYIDQSLKNIKSDIKDLSDKNNTVNSELEEKIKIVSNTINLRIDNIESKTVDVNLNMAYLELMSIFLFLFGSIISLYINFF